jgi:uncharacterized protein
MKLTLDTNVLLRAHRNASGPSQQILTEISTGRHELILSQPMLYELEEVMRYPRIRAMTKLTDAQIADHIDRVTSLCTLVDVGIPRTFGIRDVDDWAVIRTAIQGGVQVLCTGDRHLRHPSLRAVYEKHKIEVLRENRIAKASA